MKKIIAFSLWGTNPKYTKGAIENAHLSIKHYPGWKCRFYVGRSVDADTITALKNFSHVEVVEMEELGDWKSMYWRFYPASEDDVDIMLSRDCDSRLGVREAEAVKEFENSDRTFHVMRDHPAHCIGILGGMWGAKRGAIPEMKMLINKHITADNRWGIDQEFLCGIVEPKVRPNWMEHDAFYNIDKRKTDKYCRAFPTPRNKKSMFFVGQPFDAKDNTEIQLTDIGHDR